MDIYICKLTFSSLELDDFIGNLGCHRFGVVFAPKNYEEKEKTK